MPASMDCGSVDAVAILARLSPRVAKKSVDVFAFKLVIEFQD